MIFLIALSTLLLGLGHGNAQQDPQDKRVPWSTSRITGSPEAPPPFRSERTFAKLGFSNPVLITTAPFEKRMVVAEQGGKVWSFMNNPACEKADLLIDLASSLKLDTQQYGGFEALYGLAFHPRFAKNRLCYLCYVVRGKNGPHPQGTRVSEFRLDSSHHLDVATERVLLTWLGGGHNGGDLHFGKDGLLYISTGDATDPAPPDRLQTGQDISDLLSSILRIDVDKQGKDAQGKPLPYAIPADNPFVHLPKARHEVWAYGFRNPWRMGFDQPTGDLWVGDVGWEMYEMVYRVRAGGNYGWSVMEGPQVVNPEGKRGPTPISGPDISFPHTEAASITGGFVYRGTRLKELQGHYICGDWVTRKLWASQFDKDKRISHRQVAQTSQQIIAFGLDHDQELYFLDYKEKDAGIYQLVPNETASFDPKKFPRTLSETGLFQSTSQQLAASGVYPFAINSPQFVDQASAKRWVALPGNSTARFYDRAIPIRETFYSGQVFLPKDGVLVKTLSLPLKTAEGSRQQAVETQILHFDGKNWNGYTYAWNPQATEAELVEAGGRDRELTVADPSEASGFRKQTWHFSGRSQCMTCHNPWAGHALAFTPMQLDLGNAGERPGESGLGGLRRLGLVEYRKADGDKATDTMTINRLSDPLSAKESLENRARSYLHANCAHCHQSGAGGTATIDLRQHIPLAESKVVGIKPVQGAFGLPDASLITAGDPYRSALYYRMAKTGSGHMPHLGADLIDMQGLGLVHDWISQMAPTAPGKNFSTEQASAALARLKKIGIADAETMKPLLAGPLEGLVLARGMDLGTGLEKAKPGLLEAIAKVDNPGVRDLLERFLPPGQRLQRLGGQIEPASLLALKGDKAKGKEIFHQNNGPRCAACHRVEGLGSTLGPDLSGIGLKYNREQILDHILYPSKTIDPKYATQLVETTTGKTLSGLLASKSANELVLRTAEDKEIRIAATEVASIIILKTSQMPELLLRDLTAQQAVDLLDYLASLKEKTKPDS